MLKIDTLTRLAEALSGIELIQEIDQLKAEVNSHRPISKEIQDRIFQKFRLDWNYNSNAIEGNKLTYGETVALLMHGITAKGKSLKDHMDVKGHNEGINLLLDIVKSERDFTQNDIRSLHKIILVESYSSKTITKEGIPATRNISIGQYKTTPNHVKTATGAMHYYASPTETPALMDELMDWYEAAKKNDKIHHHRFVSIHPFDDGNGRMTRILMNLILMRNQYPLIVVPMKFREEYYGILSQADENEFEPLVQYFGNLLKHSLEIQLKGIKGEDISEPDDVDKKIALLKKSIANKQKDNTILRLSELDFDNFIKKGVNPLIQQAYSKCQKLNDLFTKIESKVSFWNPKINEVTENISVERLSNEQWKSPHLITKINFKYIWYNFKEVNTNFSVNTSISFDLKEKYYSISVGNKKKKKDYTQYSSKSEIHNFIDEMITLVIKEIEQKSNQ